MNIVPDVLLNGLDMARARRPWCLQLNVPQVSAEFGSH
jgi:hypothetical protein